MGGWHCREALGSPGSFWGLEGFIPLGLGEVVGGGGPAAGEGTHSGMERKGKCGQES